MKVIELLVEYKNKYYKPIARKPKPRAKKTLWYNNYEHWVSDIKSRFPDAHAYYDEENEEIMANSDDGKHCYGKWAKKKKDFQGVSFFKSRNVPHVSRNKNRLKRMEDDEKKKEKKEETRSSEFSALF